MSERKGSAFPHERLDVYRAFLRFAALSGTVVGDAGAYAVADQLERATESIGMNLIRGNSQRTPAVRAVYFDVSMASGIECAACLDVCLEKDVVGDNRVADGKALLLRIVEMLFGLRRRSSQSACEGPAPYGVPVFAHERLDVYRLGLGFVKWTDLLCRQGELSARENKKLDASSTSLVLNIAEGNGKFSRKDRTKFIDIANTAGMQCALLLDLLMVRSRETAQNLTEGKNMLDRICSMLMGWRRGLEEDQECG